MYVREKQPVNMTGLLELFVKPVYMVAELFFGSMGLNTPTKRAIAGGLMGYAFSELYHPDVSWTGDGKKDPYKPKKWNVFQGQFGANVDSAVYTAFPWWMWPTTAAVLFGMFF